MAVPKVSRGGGRPKSSLVSQQAHNPVIARASAGRVVTVEELATIMRGEDGLQMNNKVSANRAMMVTAVQTAVRLIGGGISNTPIKVIRDLGDGVFEEARNTEVWRLFRQRPNSFMRPKQFLRMSIAHVMLRGNFYCLKVKGGNGKVTELMPLDPGQCEPEKLITGEVIYRYTRRNDGKQFVFSRNEILHLYLLSFDGVKGVTPITYASETIGSALNMERHGARVFKNGARVAGIMTTDKKLGPDGRQNVRDALTEYREGGQHEGQELVLEEGLKYERMAMTSQDAQWIEARKLGKADIYEIFGIPLHMTALAEKQSNWGTGVEQHNKQFMQWVLEDYFGMWEDAINCDVISDNSKLEAMFDRAKLARGDMKTQTERDTADLQWGVASPNDVLKRRGENPRPGGDIYYPPPNMTKDKPDSKDDGSEGRPTEGDDTDESDQG